MTGIRYELKLDDLALRRDMHARLQRLEDTRPLLNFFGEHFQEEISDRFKEERGPEGAWAPLASSTIEKRLKKYGNRPITILRMEGELAGSIVYQTSQTTLSIGIRSGSKAEPYAAIHQLGGMAGRNRKVAIQARPYFGFSENDVDILEEEAAAFLLSR